jgi:hypothetical protein
MCVLLLSYNPLAARVVLVVLAVLLILGFLLLQIYRQKILSRRGRGDGAAPAAAAPPAERPKRPMFHDAVRPGSRVVRDIARIALILLAVCVAAGLLMVVLPQSTIDSVAQSFRLRNPQALAQEKISLLYLGDETKGGQFHIRGTIRNISTEPIEKLDAAVRLYGPDGILMETVVVRMDTEQITPDATSGFHLTYPDYKGQFGSYSVDFKLRQGDPLPYKDMRQGK